MSISRKIILAICILVFLISAGILANYFITGWLNSKELTDLKKVDLAEDLITDKGVVIGKYVNLYKANPDIIGWITIKGTKIDYPVMQTKDDNEYYLHRNFKKEYSAAGVPFMEAASDIFIPTSNWLIYGHHMNDGTMFHDLLKYADYDFYKNHKTIKFDTIYKGGQAKYEVIAAFYTQIYPESKDVFQYFHYAGMISEDDFNEYIEGIMALSEYDTNVSAEYGDQLITLSTCSYHVRETGRFVVVAKKK